MAVLTVKQKFDLGSTFVLAPERYDPRRESLKTNSRNEETVSLGSLAFNVRQTFNPQRKLTEDFSQCIVLDTSDAREGIVIGKKKPIKLCEVGSTKKRIQCNDVIISRLRPYLRQVAFIDDEFLGPDIEAELLCSTEFFVLRSNTSESIAFLVPFLLSIPVQKVLSASQEGGHHPRFDAEVLLTLPVPKRLLKNRTDSSTKVIQAAALYRKAEQTLTQLIERAESAITL